MDQFSQLDTFERPCFVCTSAKNDKFAVLISARMLKMPSDLAQEETPQASYVAVCQARLPGPWCGRWCPLGTKRAHHPRAGSRSHRAHCTLGCLTPPIVPLLRRQWPLPPLTGQLSPVLRRRSSRHYAGTWARQGRSSMPSPLAFNTTCGGAARWGAS